MNSIQIADDTFVAARPELVAVLIAEQAQWRRWWPDLDLSLREDRGDKGLRWLVGGGVDGTMEVWLEPCMDGTLLHYFLHGEPGARSQVSAKNLAEVNRVRRVAGKGMAFEVKFRAEEGRERGGPAR